MNENEEEYYISFKNTRQHLQLASCTLRKWDKEGKIRTIRTPSGARMFNQKDILDLCRANKGPERKKRMVCYARISTRAQLDDLGRQIDFFRQKYPSHEVVTDCCSGINWKRKGLSSLLQQSFNGNIQEIVVAHRDRLSRIGFDLLEQVFNLHGTKIVVLDHSSESSPEQELVQDVLSFIHVYSCKQMGKRRYSQTKKEKEISNQVKIKETTT
jgi:predicted site-specific integrase-resolvase